MRSFGYDRSCEKTMPAGWGDLGNTAWSLARLRRADERELYFSKNWGVWWVGVLLFCLMTLAINGFHPIVDPWWFPFPLTGPPLLGCFIMGLRRSDLRIDLKARTYRRREGFLPKPWKVEGPLDDLREVRLFTYVFETRRGALPILRISLVFRTFTIETGWTNVEEKVYDELYTIAESLRVDVVDQTGERMAWNELRSSVLERRKPKEKARAPRGEDVAPTGEAATNGEGSEPGAVEPMTDAPYEARLRPPPYKSGLESSGTPGHRMILLPPAGILERRDNTVFLLIATGLPQAFWLRAPIGSIPLRIAVAFAIVAALAVVLLGRWRRTRIEQHGHYLRLGSDIFGFHRHEGYLHRDAIYDLHVRLAMPIQAYDILADHRALVLRGEGRLIYVGTGLDPACLSWLRDSLLEILREMKGL